MKLKVTVTSDSVTITGTDTSAVLGYNIFRSQVSGGPYTQLNSSIITGQTLSYTDTAVIAGQTYYYVATGVNAAGQSPYSNEVSATIPAAPTFTIIANPTSLSFATTINVIPPAQTITVVASPPTPLPITVSVDQPWMAVNTDSPTTKANVTITVSYLGLTPVVLTGNVIVTNSDGTATNSPYKIPVTLTVTESLPVPPIIS